MVWNQGGCLLVVPEVRISGVPLDLGTEDNRKMSSETDESLPEDEAKATENEVMEPETKLETSLTKSRTSSRKCMQSPNLYWDCLSF